MDISLTSYSETDAILRIKTESVDTRVPTHFVLLLDLSDSMNKNNKLANVKHCASLLFNFMQKDDMFSLVTFADYADVVLKELPTTPTNIAILREKIAGLETGGCTNLSAGIATVSSILTQGNMKTGILLLTDGYANRGLTDNQSLKTVIQQFHEKHPAVSLTALAYGNNHNVDVMTCIAEEFQTAYNVVDNIEDAAAALGDSLGAFVSTVFQNVTVRIPESADAFGSYKVRQNKLIIGDILSNSEISVLLRAPRGTVLQVEGVQLPSLQPVSLTVIGVDGPEGRNIDVELLRLRYECTRLLRGEPSHAEVEAYAAAVGDSFFDGNPIAEMLRNEVGVLRSVDEINHATLSQHSVFVGLGRGISHGPDDPGQGITTPQPFRSVASPMQNPTQQRIMTLLRTATLQPPAD
jgi:uncharacterized protein YegL